MLRPCKNISPLSPQSVPGRPQWWSAARKEKLLNMLISHLHQSFLSTFAFVELFYLLGGAGQGLHGNALHLLAKRLFQLQK